MMKCAGILCAVFEEVWMDISCFSSGNVAGNCVLCEECLLEISSFV